jgi:Spy/CpxP family protein refolding chaperone
MKRIVGATTLVAVMVLVVAGMAMAQGAGPGQGYGPRGGMMGWGPGGGHGRGPCWNQQGSSQVTATAIDEAKAKEIASEYVSQNLPGYQVEKLVKFDRPRGAMYQVEVKGPAGELQYLHINPWGNVRAMGAGRVL